MTKHGHHDMEIADEKLAHERRIACDLFWGVLVDKYNIDLASEFKKAMIGLNERIDNELR